jgi:hypothetical protein
MLRFSVNIRMFFKKVTKREEPISELFILNQNNLVQKALELFFYLNVFRVPSLTEEKN